MSNRLSSRCRYSRRADSVTFHLGTERGYNRVSSVASAVTAKTKQQKILNVALAVTLCSTLVLASLCGRLSYIRKRAFVIACCVVI